MKIYWYLLLNIVPRTAKAILAANGFISMTEAEAKKTMGELFALERVNQALTGHRPPKVKDLREAFPKLVEAASTAWVVMDYEVADSLESHLQVIAKDFNISLEEELTYGNE